MPLRDHFKVKQTFRWEGFHAMWAGNIVRYLNRGVLPDHYKADFRVRLGQLIEVDVGTSERRLAMRDLQDDDDLTTTYTPPEPQLTVEADLAKEDVFEVQVHNDFGELVSAIELISPGNKDRPKSRYDFILKCASMLKAKVSVVLIDIVTSRRPNLLKQLLKYLEITNPLNPSLGKRLYACSLLARGSNGRAEVDMWGNELTIGAVLPQLPLWLRDDLAVPLELEATYEETCRDLRA